MSFLAYADTGAQFLLVNDSDVSPSIPNPIQVISGSIEYYFVPPFMATLLSHCPLYPTPAQVDLGTVVKLPLSIKWRQGQQVTFNIPSEMADCFVSTDNDSTFASISIVVNQVDDITKQCVVAVPAYISSDSIGQATMEIQELAQPHTYNCWAAQL